MTIGLLTGGMLGAVLVILGALIIALAIVIQAKID